jgi:hypothetical protein
MAIIEELGISISRFTLKRIAKNMILNLMLQNLIHRLKPFKHGIN